MRQGEKMSNPGISANPDWDLTNPEWRRYVDDQNELGTAIIWLIDQASAYEQLFVPTVTLRRTLSLIAAFGARPLEAKPDLVPEFELRFDAFRWVPNRVADAAKLMESKCGGRCQVELDCVDTACRCIRGTCRRK
jgi:hypothetical protein